MTFPPIGASSGTCRRRASCSRARIHDNIAYGRPDASDDEVEAAAVSVGADQFIAELATAMRPRSPSGGAPSRRVSASSSRSHVPSSSIRRSCSWTRRPRISTSPPRPAWPRLPAASPGTTTVVIAHRLQTARMADRIIVLANGSSPNRARTTSSSPRVAAMQRCGEHPTSVSSAPEHDARLVLCRLSGRPPGLVPGAPGHARLWPRVFSPSQR